MWSYLEIGSWQMSLQSQNNTILNLGWTLNPMITVLLKEKTRDFFFPYFFHWCIIVVQNGGISYYIFTHAHNVRIEFGQYHSPGLPLSLPSFFPLVLLLYSTDSMKKAMWRWRQRLEWYPYKPREAGREVGSSDPSEEAALHLPRFQTLIFYAEREWMAGWQRVQREQYTIQGEKPWLKRLLSPLSCSLCLPVLKDHVLPWPARLSEAAPGTQLLSCIIIVL